MLETAFPDSGGLRRLRRARACNQARRIPADARATHSHESTREMNRPSARKGPGGRSAFV